MNHQKSFRIIKKDKREELFSTTYLGRRELSKTFPSFDPDVLISHRRTEQSGCPVATTSEL
jgi:hypothetical protein